MQKHGCLAQLGSAVQENRPALTAAAENILCKPSTTNEVGRAEFLVGEV
jgi:hypothetical protein